MAQVNLTNTPQELITGNDSIVIVENFETIRGGRSLDVTDFAPNVIKAGHIIIKDTTTGEFKPMPVTSDGTEYEELPADNEYAGVLVASILTKKPLAAIMVRGTVNPKIAPYPMDTILADFKEAMPLILFRED